MKTWLAWSSGKDSAWALHVLRATPDVEVTALLTTVNEVYDRVAMHGVRHTLLQAQADAVGLPVVVAPLPHPCPNETYEKVMAGVVRRAREEGVDAFAFGDLFLQDIRRYREANLAGTGVEPLFPLWGRPTAAARLGDDRGRSARPRRHASIHAISLRPSPAASSTRAS